VKGETKLHFFFFAPTRKKEMQKREESVGEAFSQLASKYLA
jgi:hypothetical protein